MLIWRVNLDADKKDPPMAPVAPTRQLLGHTSNIRALTWSHEVRALVLSGSWDSSIRLWDCHTGVCLHVVTGCSDDEDLSLLNIIAATSPTRSILLHPSTPPFCL